MRTRKNLNSTALQRRTPYRREHKPEHRYFVPFSPVTNEPQLINTTRTVKHFARRGVVPKKRHQEVPNDNPYPYHWQPGSPNVWMIADFWPTSRIARTERTDPKGHSIMPNNFISAQHRMLCRVMRITKMRADLIFRNRLGLPHEYETQIHNRRSLLDCKDASVMTLEYEREVLNFYRHQSKSREVQYHRFRRRGKHNAGIGKKYRFFGSLMSPHMRALYVGQELFDRTPTLAGLVVMADITERFIDNGNLTLMNVDDLRGNVQPTALNLTAIWLIAAMQYANARIDEVRFEAVHHMQDFFIEAGDKNSGGDRPLRWADNYIQPKNLVIAAIEVYAALTPPAPLQHINSRMSHQGLTWFKPQHEFKLNATKVIQRATFGKFNYSLMGKHFRRAQREIAHYFINYCALCDIDESTARRYFKQVPNRDGKHMKPKAPK